MKISVIMTSYNYASLISEAIKSVQAQTFSDWELIIIDDCSIDNSAQVILDFANSDNRIKFIQNEQNLGLKNSILKALEETSGEWIAFLESDDIWEPDCLKKRVEIAEKFPKVALIFNNVLLFGEENAIKLKSNFLGNMSKHFSEKTFPRNIFHEFETYNRIPTFSCVMIKKTELNPNFFTTKVDRLLDWWLYIHICQKNSAYYLPQKLTDWRLHASSYTRKKTKKMDFFLNIFAYYDTLKNELPPLQLFIFLLKIFIKKFFCRTFAKIYDKRT